jgi:hypothetical protein
MSTRIRLILSLTLLSLVIAVPAARAQDAVVVLTLERQTPFAICDGPCESGEAIVDVAITATNTGDTAIEDLSLGLVLAPAVDTRGDYERSMDPAVPVTTLFGVTRPQEGSIAAGKSRTFETAIDLTEFKITRDESHIYPLSIDVRSADVPVAELRTPVLFFFQPPIRPLAFTWTVEMAPPITFGPDGVFADDSIEREVAPGGRIAAQVEMLRELAETATAGNVVLSPVLVVTLQRMAAGYRVGDRQVPQGQGGSGQAQALLASLRRSLAAPNVEVSVYPFAAPQMPAMLRSGLARDLDLQIDRGRDLVSTALGITPSTSVARAPYGQLDGNAIQRLAADGATTLLVDADTVDRPAQPLDFAPLPTAALDGPGSGDPIGLVLPDPTAQALLGSELATTDPVLAAQQVLGDLAAVWQEQPVPPEGTSRGGAVSLTEDLALPARFWEAFGRRVSAAPFLDPIGADELVTRIPPAGTTDILSPSIAFFSSTYVDGIRQQRRRIDTLRSVTPDDASLADRLAQDLLFAEGGQYVGNEAAGRAWIDAVNTATGTIFVRSAPIQRQSFTLASGNTTIPIRFPASEGPPLAVSVQLQSSQLRFPNGNTQQTTISDTERVLTFEASATGAGLGSLLVVVKAPNGRVLSRSTFPVRSTAFNRVAIGITVAAALALIALWLRRLMARRRTT